MSKTQKELKDFEKEWFSPSESMEYYDPEEDCFYNAFGQQLRNPKEYDTNSEGYTPFGDE